MHKKAKAGKPGTAFATTSKELRKNLANSLRLMRSGKQALSMSDKKYIVNQAVKSTARRNFPRVAAWVSASLKRPFLK